DALPAQCDADAKKVCPDIEAADPKLTACLKLHKKDLSADCTTALGYHQGKSKDKGKDSTRQSTLQAACEADTAKLCSGKHGRATRACLGDHKDALSAGCKAAYDNYVAKQMAIVARLRPVCKPELQKMCADKADLEIRRCLEQHGSELSAACHAALPTKSPGT